MRLKRSLLRAIPLLTMLASGLLIAGSDFALAKYVALSKAPKSFLNKTQQVQFHQRWLHEFHSYDKNKSKRVRSWYATLMSKKSVELFNKWFSYMGLKSNENILRAMYKLQEIPE